VKTILKKLVNSKANDEIFGRVKRAKRAELVSSSETNERQATWLPKAKKSFVRSRIISRTTKIVMSQTSIEI